MLFDACDHWTEGRDRGEWQALGKWCVRSNYLLRRGFTGWCVEIQDWEHQASAQENFARPITPVKALALESENLVGCAFFDLVYRPVATVAGGFVRLPNLKHIYILLWCRSTRNTIYSNFFLLSLTLRQPGRYVTH